MKTYLLPLDGGARIEFPCPPDHVTRATVAVACPLCKASPLEIAGSGKHAVNDRHYEARGHCLACMGHVGTILADPGTLFGIEEDNAVLCGRPRVY